MPKKRTIVEPLPRAWLDAVVSILQAGDPGRVVLTGRAQREMAAAGIGFAFEACELCLRVLEAPRMLGEQIHGIIDESTGEPCETWAFLCPHPLKIPEPLYIKIALHQCGIVLTMISIHTDHNGRLKAAILKYLKSNP